MISLVPFDVLEQHILSLMPICSLVSCCFVCAKFRKAASSIIAAQKLNLVREAKENWSKDFWQVIFERLFADGCLQQIQWFQSHLRYPLLSSWQQGLRRLCELRVCVASAAKAGHIHVLQYALATGWEFRNRSDIGASAAFGEQLEVLKWLRANGCEWNSEVSEIAARDGYLEILKWLRANECPFDDALCSAAAASGHLEVLKWLRAIRCPWDQWTCTSAAAHGHLEVLKWARANGCKWNKARCLTDARDRHFDDMVKWIEQQPK